MAGSIVSRYYTVLSMRNLKHLAPVLISSGILLAGNGLQGTLITVRANMEGFSPAIIGLIGASYYLGFMLGCRYAPPLITAVGHIRVYAAFAAIGAVGALTMSLAVGEMSWMAIRFVMGVVFAGLSMVTESWLNERAGSKNRGRVLGLYRTVDLAAVTGGQFLLPIVGPQGSEIFAVVAIFFCLALVPVALSRSPSPKPPKAHDIRLTMIWQVSPLAAIGVLTIGLTNSAFRIIGPLYAGKLGFDVLQVALFMSAGIIGGAIMPLPLGWLSDRFDRRWVIIAATGGAAAAGMFLSSLAAQSPQLIYAGSFLFGAFALPLYSLSIAHANDFAKPGDFIDVAAGLLFLFAIGAAVGPFAASLVMELYGPAAVFIYTTVIHSALVVFVLYRMMIRPSVPRSKRKSFVAFMRTSPAIFGLGRRSNNSGADE